MARERACRVSSSAARTPGARRCAAAMAAASSAASSVAAKATASALSHGTAIVWP